MPDKCEACEFHGDCAIEWRLRDIKEIYEGQVTITVEDCKSYKEK